MKQKILVDPNLNLSQVKLLIDNGARFVTFQYCISIVFAVTLTRFSPAILVVNSTYKKYRKKYNALSYVFGWWGIPWGPYHTLKSLKLNRKGGIDVTNDILLNLTDHGLKEQEIDFVHTNELYSKPDKWDIKALNKAFLRTFEGDQNVKLLLVGRFINTEKDVLPHLVIGLEVKSNFQSYVEIIDKAFYIEFRKHAVYELLDLSIVKDQKDFLIKQAYAIIKDR